jgi:hypothetical protein
MVTWQNHLAALTAAAIFFVASCGDETDPAATTAPRDDAASGDGQWHRQVVSGFPPDSVLWDMAMAESGPLVAVGTVAPDDCFDDVPLVVWASDDGLSWKEAYRTRRPLGGGSDSFCGDPHAAVTAGRDGFAIVGWGCSDVCTPIAFHSSDGRRWNQATVPVRPVPDPPDRSSEGSAARPLGARTVVRASPGYVVQGAAMHDVVADGSRLVAVGWEGRQPGYATVETAWISNDSGATWHQLAEGAFAVGHRQAELTQVTFAGGRFVTGGGNRCCYDQATSEFWVSDTGDDWKAADLPDGESVAIADMTAKDGSVHLIGNLPAQQVPSSVHWRLDPDGSWHRLSNPPITGQLRADDDGLVLVAVDEDTGLHLYRSTDADDFKLASSSTTSGDLCLETVVVRGGRVVAFARGASARWMFTAE